MAISRFSARALRIAAGAAFFAAAACASGDRYEAAASATSAHASVEERLKADVAWLADDARAGREAGAPGYLEAARYVAARMAAVGLSPGAGPGSADGWFQQVPLRTATPDLDAAAMSITGPDGDVAVLTHIEDFRVFPSLDRTSFDVSAPAVFVGYGVHAPQDGHDDYAGLDVEGKIVVFFNGAPDVFDSERRAHFRSRAVKIREAAARGAVAAITLLTVADEERSSWARRNTNPSRAAMTWIGPDGRAGHPGPGFQGRGALSPAASAALFDGAPRSFETVRNEAAGPGGAPRGFDLAARVSMKGASFHADMESPNVVGLIPGVHPDLKNEYLVLTAHLDHLGVSERLLDEGDDGIYNGAMDNALGVALMLEVARRFAEGPPPARSVLVLALTAEEKGLLGADYFARFPTAPKRALAANLNLDMPVMLHPFTDVIAFGAERSALGPIAAKAVEEAGLRLSPDPIPELGIFTRSDHYPFVRQGVPAVYLFPGFANGGEAAFNGFMAEHYHRPSDEISLPIRYGDAARFADVNYAIARAVADAPERPVWNEGDFFGELFAAE